MRKLTGILCGMAFAGLAAGSAQAQSWQEKWFWGAQYSLLRYHDGTDWQWATNLGGHWMITGERSALYLAYDQVIFRGGATVAVDDGTGTGTTRNVALDNGFRLQGGLLAFPLVGSFQPYFGGGIAIHQVSPETGTLTDDQATRAFAMFMGGLQLRFSGNVMVFGTYQFMPSSDRFAISSDQHVFSGGLRIALSSAHEDITQR